MVLVAEQSNAVTEFEIVLTELSVSDDEKEIPILKPKPVSEQLPIAQFPTPRLEHDYGRFCCCVTCANTRLKSKKESLLKFCKKCIKYKKTRQSKTFYEKIFHCIGETVVNIHFVIFICMIGCVFLCCILACIIFYCVWTFDMFLPIEWICCCNYKNSNGKFLDKIMAKYHKKLSCYAFVKYYIKKCKENVIFVILIPIVFIGVIIYLLLHIILAILLTIFGILLVSIILLVGTILVWILIVFFIIVFVFFNIIMCFYPLFYVINR